MRRIIINTLNKLGHQDVAEAGNGKEGLDRLNAGPVDVIITDWNMPEMSGIDLLDALKQRGSAVVFGFVTSESTPDMYDRAMSSGAKFLVSKPFTPESLERAVAGVI
jgi:two-component system chemotaxis response regulator CheY